MKNILSYQPLTTFSGEEILNWANFQIQNETSHKKQGQRILDRFYNLNKNRKYYVKSSFRMSSVGLGQLRKHPIVIRAH